MSAKPHTRRHPGDPRRIARAVLTEIMDTGKPLQDALAAAPLGTLDERDRAFVRMLVMTALRRRGWCDRMLGQLLSSGKTPPDVMHTLRLGLTQLFYMDVKPHAAVATTVDLVGPRHRSLVNAVLRRAQREEAPLRAAAEQPQHLLPAWLWDKLCAAYGVETSSAMALQHLATPPLDLTQLHAGVMPEGEQLPIGSLRLVDAGPVDSLPGYGEGVWQVQDAAASLPARLFGDDLQGRVIADLCAAPGGKTAQLAAAGAEVFAVDVSATRLERLQDNLRRLRLTATTVTADALRWEPPKPLDGILLDAPCSATGTLRRHPDVAWSKTPQDLETLTRLQAQMLRRAATILRPGGTLVYCVCSLLPEEGEAQVENLLATTPTLQRQPITAAEWPAFGNLLMKTGDVRSTPCDLASSGGIDGFYIARLKKNP
jgi:16S rRNA (cytosine967-C5)-methyltransferase